jgi:hypothetical protein
MSKKTIKYIIIDVAENDSEKFEFAKKIKESLEPYLKKSKTSEDERIIHNVMYTSSKQTLVEYIDSVELHPFADNIVLITDFSKHDKQYYEQELFEKRLKNKEIPVHVIGINLNDDSRDIAQTITFAGTDSAFCETVSNDSHENLESSLSKLFENLNNDNT